MGIGSSKGLIEAWEDDDYDNQGTFMLSKLRNIGKSLGLRQSNRSSGRGVFGRRLSGENSAAADSAKLLGQSWQKEESLLLDRSDKVNLEQKFHDMLTSVRKNSTHIKRQEGSVLESDKGLTKEELWNVFKHDFHIELSNTVFDKLFGMMDCDGNGTVDQSEFAVTMCFLLHKGSAHDKVALAYRLFDTNKDGSISKLEFTEMISSILGPDLSNLLTLPGGKPSFQKFVDSEFAGELLRFYDELERQKKKYGSKGLPLKIADNIVDNFIREDSPDQVNISAIQRNAIIERIEEAKVKTGMEHGNRVGFEVFDKALSETVDMLEQGAVVRWKKAIKEPPFDLFADHVWHTELGLKPDDGLTLKAFRKYAEKAPNLFNFLDELTHELNQELQRSERTRHYDIYNAQSGKKYN